METSTNDGDKGVNHSLMKIILALTPIIAIVLIAGIAVWQLGIFNMGGTTMTTTSGLMGYSVGGAKDIGNFRVNIENGYMPQVTDITYEGLYYDYRFATEGESECNELFCPIYSYASSKDPLSKGDDHYLSVGLTSNIDTKEYKRKNLNLVIVMDVSGSMSSSFNTYYYDSRPKAGMSIQEYDDRSRSKMQIANQAVADLLKHLDEGDRVSLVTFDDKAYLDQQMVVATEDNVRRLQKDVMRFSPKGGTNVGAGYSMGTKQYGRPWDEDPSAYENRIILLTDAQPNTGVTSSRGLLQMTKDNANDGVHTTFIGIGVDFNTKLIEDISKINGANYYSVHSSYDFNKRMDEEFEYMVTPLVYDLRLVLESDGYVIEQVYGSPEADLASGQIMRVKTLFPSPTNEQGTRGGIILLKLRKVSDSPDLELRLTYEDRNGQKYSDSVDVKIPAHNGDYHDNKAIRKAVLLARYAELLRNWVHDDRMTVEKPGIVMYGADYVHGIQTYQPRNGMIQSWERRSMPLRVTRHYKQVFLDFKEHYAKEMEEIEDEDLDTELKVLIRLSGYDGSRQDYHAEKTPSRYQG